MSFKNKVALITGASSGIGAAMAAEFARNGANVAIVGRNLARLQRVAEICATHGSKPLVIQADIGQEDAVKNIFVQVAKLFGKLDVLVNNAGFMHPGSLLEGNILDSYDKTMNVNLRAAIHITSLAAPLLAETKGNVVNISSVAGSTVTKMKGSLAYCVSKAAMNHFTRCAAKELATVGVRVNTVSPGPVKTDFLDNAGSTDLKVEDFAETMPLKRISEPKEIADLVLFLASDKAVGITGSEFVSDDGYLYASH